MPRTGDGDYNHFKRGSTYYTLAYENFGLATEPAFEGYGVYVWEGDLELI
jgi:hypothetical protein